MTEFVIQFHGRRYLAHNRSAIEPNIGWRPFRWADFDQAKKFASHAEAEMFARGLPGAATNSDVQIVGVTEFNQEDAR